MKFTRQICREVRADIEAALKVVAAKHGVELAVSAGSFSPTDYRVRVELSAALTEGGSAAQEAFTRYAPRFGAKAADFGRIVTVLGVRYELVGIMPKSHKYPFLGKRVSDGAMRKLPAESVRFVLGS